MKKLLILLLFVCGYTASQAQSLAEAKAVSNYYGEATASGEDAAIKSAKSALIAKFKPDMMQDPQFRKADGVTCWKMAELAQVFISGSGSRTTAIVYIPKAELKRVYAEATMFDELPDDGLDEFGVPRDGSAVAAKTEPAPVTPPVIIVPPSQTTQTTTQPTAPSQTVTPPPTTTQPVASTVTPEPEPRTVVAPPAGRPAKTGNPILDEIIEATNIVEINDLLTNGKNKGSLAYGRLSTMTAPENSYLLVYKPDGSIVAVYDRGANTRKNLRTGASENYASAFDNVKIIWFQLY